MSHTPGPWNAIEHRHSIPVISDSCEVAVVSGLYERGSSIYDRDETIANARLIAAAPDLLESCRAMLSAVELHGADSEVFFEARNWALAAIAKAEGRS